MGKQLWTKMEGSFFLINISLWNLSRIDLLDMLSCLIGFTWLLIYIIEVLIYQNNSLGWVDAAASTACSLSLVFSIQKISLTGVHGLTFALLI